jgi:hypothetical protein
MARKNASRHSDAQFALFVDQMKKMLDGETKSAFEHVVRRLVGAANTGPPDTGTEEGSDELQGRGQTSGSGAAEAASPSSPATTPSNLPDPPDFDAIETAARETTASRTNLLALIGQLVFSSSNNESLLIYILMVLLQTDEPSAAIVFSTLDTTRARLDLVSRLARIKIADREIREELDQVVGLFNEANQVRNEFLHAMYTVDTKGAITHTQTMRAVEKNGRISIGQQNSIDQKSLDGLVKACGDLRSLNRKVRELLPRLQEAITKPNQKAP